MNRTPASERGRHTVADDLHDRTVCLMISDLGRTYALNLEHSALTCLADRRSEAADATVTLERMVLNRLVLRARGGLWRRWRAASWPSTGTPTRSRACSRSLTTSRSCSRSWTRRVHEPSFLRHCHCRGEEAQQLPFGAEPIRKRRLTVARAKYLKGTLLDIFLQSDLPGDE